MLHLRDCTAGWAENRAEGGAKINGLRFGDHHQATGSSAREAFGEEVP